MEAGGWRMEAGDHQIPDDRAGRCWDATAESFDSGSQVRTRPGPPLCQLFFLSFFAFCLLRSPSCQQGTGRHSDLSETGSAAMIARFCYRAETLVQVVC